MSSNARVGSIAALGEFRSELIIFMEKANQALGESIDAVRRTRVWLQEDRRPFWDRELHRRQVILDQARQELLSARMSTLRDDLTAQLANVRKAERYLQEAEEKRQAVRKWLRDFDHVTEPLLRHVQALRELIDTDMPNALLFLSRAQETLAAYSLTPGSLARELEPAPNPEPGQP